MIRAWLDCWELGGRKKRSCIRNYWSRTKTHVPHTSLDSLQYYTGARAPPSPSPPHTHHKCTTRARYTRASHTYTIHLFFMFMFIIVLLFMVQDTRKYRGYQQCKSYDNWINLQLVFYLQQETAAITKQAENFTNYVDVPPKLFIFLQAGCI